MDYTKDDFVDFFERFPNGIQNKYGAVTHPPAEFLRRMNLFMQHLLDDFDFTKAFLCGGSLFAIMDKSVDENEFESMPSDIDLFVLRDGNNGNNTVRPSIEKLRSILLHFHTFAKQKDLQCIFILRGLLIEVMIQGHRNIQVLLTSYITPESCISNVSVLHLHMYYDGILHASEVAIDNILRKETRMCRAPIKDTKIPQLISRGVTPVGEILTTKMDSTFLNTLTLLELIKKQLDEGQTSSAISEKDYPLFVTDDINLLIAHAEKLASAKWGAKRLLWLANCKIKCDIDIFDLSVRLPAPDILYRCAFFRINDDTLERQIKGRKRKMLKIRNKESPAIFLERNVRLFLEPLSNSSALSTNEVIELSIEDSVNIRFLERYFERQAVVRFHKDITHIVNSSGLLTCEKSTSPVNITFFITIYDDLESIMYFDLLEVQTEK